MKLGVLAELNFQGLISGFLVCLFIYLFVCLCACFDHGVSVAWLVVLVLSVAVDLFSRRLHLLN